MKKYINIAFIYAVLALCCGVFYREFTKWNGFSGKTTLAFAHVHLFVLGTLLFLFIACFSQLCNLTKQKQFQWFSKIYHIGLVLMVMMLLVRGVPQVLQITLSSTLNAIISGIAGISHIILGLALILFFLALQKCESNR